MITLDDTSSPLAFSYSILACLLASPFILYMAFNFHFDAAQWWGTSSAFLLLERIPTYLVQLVPSCQHKLNSFLLVLINNQILTPAFLLFSLLKEVKIEKEKIIYTNMKFFSSAGTRLLLKCWMSAHENFYICTHIRKKWWRKIKLILAKEWKKTWNE